jgi:hypothetical protein
MSDIQAAERRIDELVDDLIEAARAVEMHSYSPPGRGRAIQLGAVQYDLQAAREAIAEYVAAARRAAVAAEQDVARLDWLEAHRPPEIVAPDGDDTEWVVFLDDEWENAGQAPTLRAAIDAARTP